ncbi:hypothetical protein KUTeg_015356 [Tegillarca granosa]|uniref:TIR domain-containing protein n=1 Tax=Tegillarca granosa TaxID=220873 RepID=A0ABQ9EUL5_TEGGR|nr:hypothetical protein KUTeg_015356 [Tegillarca granosa]
MSMMSSDTDTTPLLHGDNEENVSIDICENSRAPPLPPGKLYHVFFSYAESDREFAANLINKLESELGYKCCDHQRDFIPGWKITDNIKHFVMSSLKTVVLISEESVKSAWCSYEAELTFHMSMEMRKKILIPILVDDCTIPDHLKPLTYIDARKNLGTANWWQKLVDTTSQPDEVPIFESDLPSLSSQPYSFNPNFSNLEHIVTIKSKQKSCLKEEIPTKSVPSELCCRGLKVPIFSIQRRNGQFK